MPLPDPALQDEALQRRIPSYYLCQAQGCGEITGKVLKKYCNEHSSIAGREELKAENAKDQKRLNELREKKEWIYAEK